MFGGNLLTALRNLFGKRGQLPGLTFSRPLVVLQSDDWGRVGVRDREGYELLRSRGFRLGERAYDLYTLETADDVGALASMLSQHKDSAGRRPCMVLNLCTANLDFPKMRTSSFRKIELMSLAEGLPGVWSRPGLLEAYRSGIAQEVFFPGLHGVTHFSPVAVKNALEENGERARLLHTFWEAETPYIFWRMPWIGYEYWNPAGSHAGFMGLDQQRNVIRQACENFTGVFGRQPSSACAPGYRSNRDTHQAWSESGVRIAEHGTESGLRAPHMDEFGMLHLYRTIDFEPSQNELDTEKYLQIAGNCFEKGLPVVISMHAVNFHSTLKNFREPALEALDSLLNALESRHPELLYAHDEDLYGIVTQGALQHRDGSIAVSAERRDWNLSLTLQGAR